MLEGIEGKAKTLACFKKKNPTTKKRYALKHPVSKKK